MGSYTICSRCCQNWVNCLVVTHWNGCQNQIDHLQSSWLVFEKWTRRKGELTRVALWSLGNCIASRGLRNRKQIVLFKLLYSYWLAFLCAEYNSEPWIRKAIGKIIMEESQEVFNCGLCVLFWQWERFCRDKKWWPKFVILGF